MSETSWLWEAGESVSISRSTSPQGGTGKQRYHAWLESREASRRQNRAQGLNAIEQAMDDMERCMLLADGNAQIQACLTDALKQLRQTHQTLRAEACPLGDCKLEGYDLQQGLERLGAMAAAASAIHVETRIDPAVCTYLPGQQVAEVLAAVHEALCNALCHASASRLGLRAQAEGRRLVISVADDGEGFDIATTHFAKCGGLATMQSHTEAAQGLLQVESAPGAGTIVTITMPLRPS